MTTVRFKWRGENASRVRKFWFCGNAMYFAKSVEKMPRLEFVNVCAGDGALLYSFRVREGAEL